ncbi:MAG: 3-deoxy-manno-octulosonate cytidylyltransferase [Planctomycetota bacterium]|nr:3-deoxy-manno-octulosonate cytidylyltransferase [Planctomycetota bacterium]
MDDVRSIPPPIFRSYVVIPARLASTRLPRKLLLDESGKPLIQHTYEAAQQAVRPLGICAATDHSDLVKAITAFGGNAVSTDPQARCGTDRVAEIARSMSDVDIFVNVQGDEPEIDPSAIDQVIQILENDQVADIATLATPIRHEPDLRNPNCVKVVRDHRNHAIYFSRSPIPFPRDWDDTCLHADPASFLRHLGLYAYRRAALLRFATLAPSASERLENLEQLRALHYGLQIAVGIVEHYCSGIDTRDDYDAFLARQKHWPPTQ